MKHDDLVGGRSGIHLPDITIPSAISKVDWPLLDLSSIDVGKAVRGAAAAAHIGRRRHRPRWPLAIGGLIVAALASWALLKNDGLRTRLADAVGTIRDRISTMKRSRFDQNEIDAPIAFDRAPTAPIEASAFTVSGTIEPTSYPAGLGSYSGDTNPFLEETASRGEATPLELDDEGLSNLEIGETTGLGPTDASLGNARGEHGSTDR